MPHFALDSWIYQTIAGQADKYETAGMTAQEMPKPQSLRWKYSTFEKMDLDPPLTCGNRFTLCADAIRECARRAFSSIAYSLPEDQLETFAAIAHSSDASPNERFVAQTLFENALEARNKIFPICQDTGTALVYAWKGSRIDIEHDANLEHLLAEGAGMAYKEELLRNSQNGPISMTEERNTGDNLPAGIHIREVPGEKLLMLFAAKGGGSTSRTSLTLESPSILRPETLEQVLRERIRALGPSGCPPYAIAVVLGGATPSQTLYAAELAALGMLDDLPSSGDGSGTPIRDPEWESIILKLAAESGIGAQWGGMHMATTARAIHLARHAAALPLAVAVSCAANRHMLVIADRGGWYRQVLAEHIAEPKKENDAHISSLQDAMRIVISRGSSSWLESLRMLPAGTMVILSGPVLVARDAAHARILRIIEQEGKMPEWFMGLPVFYAGPTEAKPSQHSGAFGPTTASRMDSYLEPFMKYGASLVTIAKGNRSPLARDALRAYRGVYLAAIGGAAAMNAAYHIRNIETLAFSELGMEAVRIVELDNLPALVVIDAKGKDFYPA